MSRNIKKAIKNYPTSLFTGVLFICMIISYSGANGQANGQIMTKQQGNWGDNATWKGNRVPSRNDNVSIRHQVTFNRNQGSGKVTNITFNHGGSGTPELTIASGKTLKVNGNFNASNGSIVVNGNLNLTGRGSKLKNFRGGDFSGPVTFPGNKTDSLVYPLGNSGSKVAVAFGNVPQGKSFTVSKNTTNPKNAIGSTTTNNLSDVSSEEYFEISPNSNLTQKVRITLFWDANGATDFSQITTITNLAVAHFNGNKWENYGRSGSGGSLNGDGHVTSNLTNNFSPFTFGSKNGGGSLPVEMTYFNAFEADGNVSLKWKTATETNNSHFLIQRRTPNGDFDNIGKVRGFGTSYEPHTYDFQDNVTSKGTYYYRLKQVDHDGTFAYSEIKAVQYNGTDKGSRLAITEIYPNPILNQLSLKLNGVKSQVVTLKIHSSGGNIQQQKQFKLRDNTKEIRLNGLDTLPAGIYILTVKTEEHYAAKRIIKQ